MHDLAPSTEHVCICFLQRPWIAVRKLMVFSMGCDFVVFFLADMDVAREVMLSVGLIEYDDQIATVPWDIFVVSDLDG